MIILEQKVDNLLWKQYLLYQKENAKYKIYKPETKIENVIYQLILELTYKHIPEYNTIAVIEYLSILEKLKRQNNLIDKDKKKIENLIEKLQIIDKFYIINRKFYPQITITKKEIFRFYYHPFFNLNLKYIKNLYSKFNFINKEQYDIYEFDVNGALVRTFFYYLSVKYKNEKFKTISEINQDIYEFISRKIFKQKEKEFNRNEFKQDLVSLIAGKEKVIQSFNMKYHIDEKLQRFLINEILNVDLYKLTLKMCLLILSDLKRIKILNLPFFNYDGGIFIVNKNQTINLPQSYKLIKL